LSSSSGADGGSYGDGAPRSVDRTLTQPVGPLPAGVVRVAWRTVSADGHPIEGGFTFTTATGVAAAGPAITGPMSDVDANPSDVDGGPDWFRWVAGGGVLVVAALLGAAVRWRRR